MIMYINPLSSTEIDIALSEAEISLLEKKTLVGLYVPRGIDGEEYRQREVTLFIGDVKSSLYIGLRSHPEDADFAGIKKEEITITTEGYAFLLRKGAVTDRPGHFCRVVVYKK